MDGETEEEKFERAQKEAGIKKAEFSELEADARTSLFLFYLNTTTFINPKYSIFTAKKAPAKPVESIKPRLRAEFEEFQKLLTAMILEQKVLGKQIERKKERERKSG